MSIKVILADDHAMIREGMRNLLEFDGSIKVISEANDGEECLEMLKTVVPDILLLDINMPKKNGLDVLAAIKKQKINTKVIILTVHNEVDYLIKAIDLGVDGYMLKDLPSSELMKAIDSVFKGEQYIQPDLIPLFNNRLISRDIDSAKVDSLTSRETEVLILIAKGMFNKEIADSLDISERTVKNHISNIFKKIEVADRTQAAVFAIKNNLIKLY